MKINGRAISGLKASEVEAAKEILRERFPEAYRIEGPVFDKTPAVEETIVVPVKLDVVEIDGDKFYAIVTENDDCINLTGGPFDEFPYRATIETAIKEAKENHPSLTEDGMVKINRIVVPEKDIDGTGSLYAVCPGPDDNPIFDPGYCGSNVY